MLERFLNKQCKLVFNVNDPEAGTVTYSPLKRESCGRGAVISMTAVSNDGYRFVQWSDGNTNASRTATIYNDTTFTAQFEEHECAYLRFTSTDSDLWQISITANSDNKLNSIFLSLQYRLVFTNNQKSAWSDLDLSSRNQGISTSGKISLEFRGLINPSKTNQFFYISSSTSIFNVSGNLITLYAWNNDTATIGDLNLNANAKYLFGNLFYYNENKLQIQSAKYLILPEYGTAAVNNLFDIYIYAFKNNTTMEYAPEIPDIPDAAGDTLLMPNMFYGCTNLKQIISHITFNEDASYYRFSWLKNAGTNVDAPIFYNLGNGSYTSNSDDDIPSNWEVRNSLDEE